MVDGSSGPGYEPAPGCRLGPRPQTVHGLDRRAGQSMPDPVCVGCPLTLEALEDVARRGRLVQFPPDAGRRGAGSLAADERVRACGDYRPSPSGLRTRCGQTERV